MASNKKRIGLDQPARDSVDVWSKIDQLISEMNKPKQDDEFSVNEYIDRIESQGGSLSMSQAHKQLMTKVKNGVLVCRKTKINGSQINVFRFV